MRYEVVNAYENVPYCTLTPHEEGDKESTVNEESYLDQGEATVHLFIQRTTRQIDLNKTG